jgi:tetratricopeptide (TPR) repeat protein
MLKRTFVLLFSVILLSGCNSSEKLLQKGEYDRAIEKAVKKLRKDPGNDKELYVLKEAYIKANSFDLEQISFLEKEGRSENYVRIYQLYGRLDRRQDRIKTLPTRLMSEFRIVNYDDELIASKEQAAETAYHQGLDYLDLGGKENARRAFYEFENVQSLYPNYKDVNDLQKEAAYLGTNQVLFIVENNSEVMLPERFESELRKISLGDLNNRWIQYSVYENEDVDYDYFVALNINRITMSPEGLEREKYSETTEIQDGTRYVLDDRGNVMKDSLGNDIKVPNMVNVTADIQTQRQFKEATVGGSLDYVDLRTEQLVKSENIGVTAVFEHISGSYTGDERALSQESKEVIERNAVPFPDDEFMLMDAATLLKERAKDIMYRNRELLSSTY